MPRLMCAAAHTPACGIAKSRPGALPSRVLTLQWPWAGLLKAFGLPPAALGSPLAFIHKRGETRLKTDGTAVRSEFETDVWTTNADMVSALAEISEVSAHHSALIEQIQRQLTNRTTGSSCVARPNWAIDISATNIEKSAA